MSYQVFARKYRPKSFDDVLGQDHVIRTLKNAIDQDRLAHAYLFVGPRGTGKTSTARIFAKALNCPNGPKIDFDPDDPVCVEIAEGNSLDVFEIDGASNNGVEQVRELRETVKFAPSSSKFKIYYIDEVHMLSTAAFNALLKTLEEPPPHVKFIFATTEPDKILPTIISRCQRFDLRRIPTQIIADHLLHIAKVEKVQLEENAAFAIAKGADGGMRDAQSMLDQLVAFCGEKIEEENVLEVFGFTSAEVVANLTEQLLTRKNVDALETIHVQDEKGKDLGRFLGDVIGYLRNLLVAIVDPENEFGDLAPEITERLREQSKKTTPERLLKLIDHFADTETKMKWAPNKKLHLEIAVIKAAQLLTETTISDVISILHGAESAAAELPVTAAPAAAKGGEKKNAVTEPNSEIRNSKSEPEPEPTPEPEPEPTPEPEPEPTPEPEPEPTLEPEPEPTPEPLQSLVPSHRSAFAPLWHREAVRKDREATAISAAERQAPH
ncbi:MAG: DNA polymerase III subunit gamma/tau, partial [Verrucomicrobiota bacterium]